jgi:hypothetical protein
VGDEVEPYHDRIRETVVAGIAGASRKAYHLGLARALLDAGGADEETLAVHFEGAGERAEAAEHAVRAADQAMDALGFDRAARLYRQAIAALGEGDARRRLLHEKLGAALGNTGHGPEAAAAYLVSVEGAETQHALELRRRAADHYLMSGHVEEGLAAMRAVLAATGLSLPATQLGAVLRILPLYVFSWLRGLRFRERAEQDIPAGELLRIETCASVSFSMIAVNVSAALYFQKRFLLLALRAGEPHRVLRALLVELGLAAAEGGDVPTRSARKLERLCAALIDRLRSSGARFEALESSVEMMSGVTSMFRGRLREAREHYERALDRFDAHPVRFSNHVALSSLFLVGSLYGLGEWKEAAQRLSVFLEEARARDDLWLDLQLSLTGYLPALMEDRPDAAHDAMDRLAARWPRAFHPQRFSLLSGYSAVVLYRDAGSGDAAVELVKAWWPTLSHSGVLLLSRPMRTEMLRLRGQAYLAAAAAAPQARRLALLRAVDRDARALERLRTRVALAHATGLRAGVAAGRGNRELCRTLLADAAATWEQAEAGMNAAAARRRLGELTGGDEGRALVEAADAFMSAQGIRSPARMTATLLPGAW